jgi:hypothetical protein
MNEFMGLVTYPFRFSTSFFLTSADLFTHSSMFRTGIETISLVSILKGAVSFGVFGFSLFAVLTFLAFGIGFARTFSSSSGELDGTTVRPLRVRRVVSSISIEDRGVGGDLEKLADSFCLLSEPITHLLNIPVLRGTHCIGYFDHNLNRGRSRPGVLSVIFGKGLSKQLTY